MTTWFDGAEIANALHATSSIGDASGLPPSSLTRYAFAAIERVEQLTGCTPFLADGQATWRYDPPSLRRGESYLLDLQTGFVEIASVELDVFGGAGTILTNGVDYWPLPENADRRNRPFTWIRFASSPSGDVQSIRVTGVPGAVRVIPAEVYEAALAYACALATEALRPTAALARVRQGSVEFEYRDDETMVSAADERLRRACRPYMRG